MVHVPFLNIELPEPKLGALIPNTIELLVLCTAKAGEYGRDFLHPPSSADLRAFEEEFEASIPREFDRVRKRYAEGKIVNSEQLSSELEDAGFDWYRRQMRTSVIGATDEDMEDLAARKLGLAGPSQKALVEERFLADAIAAAGGMDPEEEIQEAAALQALREHEEEHRRQLAARTQRLSELRRQVRPRHRQVLGTITNASSGLLLGVLVFKSAVMAARRLFRRRKPQQRPPAQRPRQTPPQSAPTIQQRPQTEATQAPAASRQPVPAVQKQQAQTVQSQEQSKASAATATSGRKTRQIKKR